MMNLEYKCIYVHGDSHKILHKLTSIKAFVLQSNYKQLPFIFRIFLNVGHPPIILKVDIILRQHYEILRLFLYGVWDFFVPHNFDS